MRTESKPITLFCVGAVAVVRLVIMFKYNILIVWAVVVERAISSARGCALPTTVAGLLNAVVRLRLLPQTIAVTLAAVAANYIQVYLTPRALRLLLWQPKELSLMDIESSALHTRT